MIEPRRAQAADRGFALGVDRPASDLDEILDAPGKFLPINRVQTLVLDTPEWSAFTLLGLPARLRLIFRSHWKDVLWKSIPRSIGWRFLPWPFS